jgi:hypothetical protein
MKITIKKREFKNWIYENGLTQTLAARELHIPLQEMKDKLTNREAFTEEQIRNLVYLMGAVDAFKVMYFPTLKDRLRVEQEVFIGERDERKEKL